MASNAAATGGTTGATTAGTGGSPRGGGRLGHNKPVGPPPLVAGPALRLHVQQGEQLPAQGAQAQLGPAVGGQELDETGQAHIVPVGRFQRVPRPHRDAGETGQQAAQVLPVVRGHDRPGQRSGAEAAPSVGLQGRCNRLHLGPAPRVGRRHLALLAARHVRLPSSSRRVAAPLCQATCQRPTRPFSRPGPGSRAPTGRGRVTGVERDTALRTAHPSRMRLRIPFPGAMKFCRPEPRRPVMAIYEYPPGAAFPGVIGRTTDESSPAWPQPVRALPGSPNVLFIVLDDVGFGQLGCFGSPISTPNFDALAANGLRYNNMHTTALCSPSRSCIITGRNHHSNGMACITELASVYPGYNGIIPFENGFLSEMLLGHGYSTFMVGKWHLTPSNQETAAGPYDRWPLARGFERFYGFLGGDTSQWYPDLVHDNHQVEPPATPAEGYHLTEDLVDRSMKFIADAKQIDPAKPFYLHLCFGAMHAPHHVAKEWADRYAGQFDDGWDAYREKVFTAQKELGIVPADTELSRHDPDVPDWDSLPEPSRRLFSRFMEVFAGFLTHTDAQLGRLLDFLRARGDLDNTLVMVISDNGASAEGGPTGTTNEAQFFNNAQEPLEDSLARIDEIGGPTTFNHYPWGWTWAGNTPFRRWKRETYRGGASDPFIVSWPAGIRSRGEVREQYAHIIDMVPTLLDLLGIDAPGSIRGVTQSP